MVVDPERSKYVQMAFELIATGQETNASQKPGWLVELIAHYSNTPELLTAPTDRPWQLKDRLSIATSTSW